MKKLFIANWKMKLNLKSARELAQKYPSFFQRTGLAGKIDLAVAPTFTHFAEVKNALNNFMPLCGQDVSAFDSGAYTGEVAASALVDFGCKFCIVGHSERRINLHEPDELIKKKIMKCAENKIIPVLCIGETDLERKKGDTDGVLLRQLHGALENADCFPASELVIAYEPVWAIGSGTAVSAEDLEIAARLIKRGISGMFTEKFFDSKVRIIYGGSVDTQNAEAILKVNYISGLLIGSSSLNAKDFFDILSLSQKI